jgi:hypothetical protein
MINAFSDLSSFLGKNGTMEKFKRAAKYFSSFTLILKIEISSNNKKFPTCVLLMMTSSRRAKTIGIQKIKAQANKMDKNQ